MLPTRYRILIVEDELTVSEALRMTLEKANCYVDVAANGAQALEFLAIPNREYAVILIDKALPDMSGIQVAKEIRRFNEESMIVFHSGDGSKQTVREAFQAGAVDYLEKGLPKHELIATIENFCQKYEQTTRTLKASLDPASNEKLISRIGLIGRSDSLAESVLQAERYRSSKENVLILGETGTGKEHIARALHSGDPARFLVVNCATYQSNTALLESELFGYEKGAFTGANNMGKIGILEAARGGTVFFDEIHLLSLEAQGKLLRALQEKKIRRVGGSTEYEIEFRIIAAGKLDLAKLVEEHRFMPDIYYRINVLSITVPALRDRKEDIEPLVWHFTEQFCKDNAVKKTFLMKTIRYLENYNWPGNVRELGNTVKKLLTDCPNKAVDPLYLDAKFFKVQKSEADNLPELDRRQYTEKFEFIKSALVKANWNRAAAAEDLGVAYTTLFDIMKKFKLDKIEPRQVS